MGIVHTNFPKFDNNFHIYIDQTTSLSVVEIQMLNSDNEIIASRKFMEYELRGKDIEINFINSGD